MSNDSKSFFESTIIPAGLMITSGAAGLVLPSAVNYMTRSTSKYIFQDSYAKTMGKIAGSIAGSVLFPVMLGATIYFAEGLREGNFLHNYSEDFIYNRPCTSIYGLLNIANLEIAAGIITFDPTTFLSGISHLSATHFSIPAMILPMIGCMLGQDEYIAKTIIDNSYNVFYGIINEMGNAPYPEDFVG